ncbi:MAG: type III-B CRISPR module RAMP protein Cmr4 [Thermomicrobiales bacterium]|nr:MAG: type III-B CRISPR module RAMP protein Cmr4 [Thermomicrobiales bacterium]
MSGRMLFIRSLSPVHTGTGQAVGVIDLPVARERVTGWPYLPGSTIKGVLRDACDPNKAYGDDTKDDNFFRAFGPETDHASDFAGALAFCDGHLLCFPVRSFHGTFAWLTCPLALARWQDDAQASGITIELPGGLDPGDQEALVARGSKLAVSENGPIYLEELDLKSSVPEGDPVGELAGRIGEAVFTSDAWRTRFRERLAVVPDDIFSGLAESATEIAARIRLSDESKTVARGALWYEEAVPPQAIFACPVILEDRLVRSANGDIWKMLETHITQPLQIGGNASVGRGLVSLRLWA